VVVADAFDRYMDKSAGSAAAQYVNVIEVGSRVVPGGPRVAVVPGKPYLERKRTRPGKSIMAKTARMEQIEAMLADDPADEMLHYMLGMEHSSAGDDTGAVAVFRALIARSPYVPAYHMAGQALIRLQQFDEAAAMLQAGIAEARKQGDFHALGEMEALLGTVE
jgi:hypothetical protein